MTRAVGIVAVCAALAACGAQDVELLDGAADAGGGDGATSDLGVADGAASDTGPDTGACMPQSCEGHATECANCIDDDGDGLVDSADPECLGPCDNSEEAGLLPGVGGETSVNCSRDRIVSTSLRQSSSEFTEQQSRSRAARSRRWAC